MSADLERRYARLLVAYPSGYRHEHQEELLATLLDSAHPSAREAAAWQLSEFRATWITAKAAGWVVTAAAALALVAVARGGAAAAPTGARRAQGMAMAAHHPARPGAPAAGRWPGSSRR